MKRYLVVVMALLGMAGAGVTPALPGTASTTKALKSACPLSNVKLPGVLYVGKPLNHQRIPNFSDKEMESLAKAVNGGWNVCFGVSSDGKKLLAYAFPAILLCVDRSGSVLGVEESPRAAIRKDGTFTASGSSPWLPGSFFKGRILRGGKAAGTLREKREVQAAPGEERLCDTGIVRWSAKRVAR